MELYNLPVTIETRLKWIVLLLEFNFVCGGVVRKEDGECSERAVIASLDH